MGERNFVILMDNTVLLNDTIKSIKTHPALIIKINRLSSGGYRIKVHNRSLVEIQEFLDQFFDKTSDYQSQMID
jgi:hypothetical protein